MINKPLHTIVQSISTGLNPRQNFVLNSDGAHLYYVTVKEISTDKVVFSSSTDLITEEAKEIINKRSRLEKGDILFSGIGTIGKVAYIDFPTNHWDCSESIFLIKPNEKEISGKYLSYILSSDVAKKQYEKGAAGAIMKGVRKATLENLLIPIPSLSEQTRIVGILDTFTASIENLKEQIAERRKQFEYYRDEILNLEGKEKVEINSIASFVKERISASNLTPYNYTSVENMLKDKAGRQDAENVPTEGNWVKYQNGDILIGNIRPYLRKIWLSDREGGTNGDVIVIRPKDGLLPKFLYYCLSSESFFLYYNQSLKDGKMPRGEKSRVLSFVIPLIEKGEQSRIVSILDTFEASILNLEAQLKERQKQYEYYRNQLLTFE